MKAGQKAICGLFFIAFGFPRLRNIGARPGRVEGGLLIILRRAKRSESSPGDSPRVTVPIRAGSGREEDSVCVFFEG